MKYETILVQEGQSIWDICARYYGDLSGFSLLQADNDLSLNSTLVSGQQLKIRSSLRTRDRNVVREMFDKSNFTINNHDGTLPNFSQPILPIKHLSPSIKSGTLNVQDYWIVQDGQSIYDVSVQWYGTIEGVSILLSDNGLTTNDEIRSGDKLKLRSDLVRLRINQNVINNNDNYSQTHGQLRVVLVDLGNETSDHMGWITVDVLGGMMPYTYEWYNEENELIATSQNLANIGSGVYTINATDSESTVASLAVTVSAIINLNYLVDQTGAMILDEVGDGIIV